jgi:hypothetical protein
MLFLAAQGYKLGVLYISALMHKVPKGQFLPRGSMTPWLLWEQWPLIHQGLNNQSSARLGGTYDSKLTTTITST